MRTILAMALLISSGVHAYAGPKDDAYYFSNPDILSQVAESAAKAAQTLTLGDTAIRRPPHVPEHIYGDEYRAGKPAPEEKGYVSRKSQNTNRDFDFYGKTPDEARRYAHQRDETNTSHWMEPFSKYDMFGKPSAFHPDFGKRK